MIRIAILGGGISGLAAAYQLEQARQQNPEIDWHLYESSNRLGGIIETTQQDDFILEGGPDAWVTEKPWARDLAIELGLKNEIISSNDATRKTYILRNGKLEAIPDCMRLMVPEDLATLENSPLFTDTARAAYAAELANAAALKAQATNEDESVATFVLRHFGEEVLTTLAAPLLSGIFGGDVRKLSVRSAMPQFVAMEREHGSLILALQKKRSAQGNREVQSIFTSLRNGMATLTEALIAKLPPERLNLNRTVLSLKRQGKLWLVRTTAFAADDPARTSKKHFRHVLMATPLDATRQLLTPLSPEAAAQLPTEASSAILATFTWPADQAVTFNLPTGFGFLVPQPIQSPQESVISTEAQRSGETSFPVPAEPSLLAATFADQKFPHRAPTGARTIRAFFGGQSADTLANAPDEAIIQTALTQLTKILGPIPQPTQTKINRWPRSLPQYEVGHQTRMEALTADMPNLPGLHLLGNSYTGVGLPDLIQAARTKVRNLSLKPLPKT